MQGRYESLTENSKNQFGVEPSHVKFQSAPYKTSHSEYLNIVATVTFRQMTWPVKFANTENAYTARIWDI